MKELTSVEAKTNFGSVLEAVEDGEEFVVTRNGKHVARISPVTTPRRLSREEAVARLATFAKRHKLTLGGLDWRKLRDEGRK